MKIGTRSAGDALIVELVGDLDARSAGTVQEKLIGLLTGRSSVVLDFTGTLYISSAGLRALLVVYRAARAAGTGLAVVGLSSELRGVLAATGFLGFLTVADSVDSGLLALNEATP